MDNFSIDKETIKKNNRDATIKHYILGFMLECAVKDDVNVTVDIRRFLLHELKVMTEEAFVDSLRRARTNRMLRIKETKKSYKSFKNMMVINSYDEKEQIKIVQKLQEFANNYENGIYINSKMIESSFVDS